MKHRKCTISPLKRENSKYKRGLKYVVYFPNPDGKRKTSRYFKTKKLAQEAVDFFDHERKEWGENSKPFSAEERQAVEMWRKASASLPAHRETSLLNVIKAYVNDSELAGNVMTCQQVADNLTLKKQRLRKSKAWIDSLEYRLKPFLALYADWEAHAISKGIIEEFLTEKSLNLAPRTILHYRGAISLLFSHAISLHAVARNPCEGIELAPIPHKTPEILTVADAEKLLACADKAALPVFLVRLFAGLRRSEAEKIDWRDIRLNEGIIVISSAIAKTKARRVVKISDNLKEWLQPLAKEEGKLTPSPASWRKGSERAIRKSGINYPNNCLRHSFVSYHLALSEDEGKTATQSGHSVDVLRQNYKSLITDGQEKAFWKIYPCTKNPQDKEKD